MTQANCQKGGTDLATSDVCKTPPVNVPVCYSNSANGAMANPATYTVHIAGTPAHNLATKTPSTSGDEAGSSGGTGSGTCKGQSRHTAGSQKVIIAGTPSTRMGDPTSQNSGNACGARITPSQNKVQVVA
jgi:hypothetical protein